MDITMDDYRMLEANFADAQRLIIIQAAEIARLKNELAAKSPPPAVAPYHRLDALPMCIECSRPIAVRVRAVDGTLALLCRACSYELMQADLRRAMGDTPCYECGCTTSTDWFRVDNSTLKRLCEPCSARLKGVRA